MLNKIRIASLAFGSLLFLACSSTQELELGQEAEWKENNEVRGKVVRTGENSYEFREDLDKNGFYEKIYVTDNNELIEVRYLSPNGKIRQKINYFQGMVASSTLYNEDGSVKGIAYYEGETVTRVELPQLRKKVEFPKKK
ncbi:MAG: hypothetical protein NZM25_09075 [Leptospiraceae bacterium]|nr:hypothetical protein [Leptospiraceae bacterium]MDW8307291.1 hypothetical protein [Leptospiraceae bacterium]